MAQQTFNDTKINVEFEEATSRQQLNSGENISMLFGKIKKIFSDLKSVCFSGSYKDLNDTPTTATADTNGLMSAADKTKLDNADNKYALKSKYGNTTINVGRATGTTVGVYSTAEGIDTTASGNYSHAEGLVTKTIGEASHAEGGRTKADGYGSHAEGGCYADNGSGKFVHIGSKDVVIDDTTTITLDGSRAYGANSHAEGCQTLAYGAATHSEGWGTFAKNDCAHAEGYNTQALAHNSHAEGYFTIAKGENSHAEGFYTITNRSNEVAMGRFNQSNDKTLFSIGDGRGDTSRHNAFEITTTGGKLHDKDIATIDDIPTSLPADGGNANTVGGKSADDFAQIIDFGFNQTDTKIAIGKSGKTTIYRCSNWTGYPSEFIDSQGTLIAINYNGSGTVGTDNIWCIQFIINPRQGTRIYVRYIDSISVSEWKEISTMPIKSEEFTASTDAWSHIQLFSTSENKKPLAVIFVNTPRMYSVFYHSGYCYLELYNNLMQTIPNTSVNFVLYYMEV